MNSVFLLQQAVMNWLSADDVAELSMPHTEALVAAVNKAMLRIWRQTPVRYRQRPWSQSFKAPRAGTATVSNGSRDFSVSISGVSLDSSEWQYCSIQIGSYWNTVVNNGVSGEAWSADLLHAWPGTTGTYSATIYQDAAFQPHAAILIERLIGQVEDVLSGRYYYPQGTGSPWFDIRRVRFPEDDGDDMVRSLVTVSRATEAVTLEGMAEVAPRHLGALDASVARALEVDDEIGGIIADAAGIELQRHPLFRGGSLDLAFDAMRQLNQIPKRGDTHPPSIGTPLGW